MKTTIEYRIIGTNIISSAKTLKECREQIRDSFGKCRFEYWSTDGRKSGDGVVRQYPE